MFSYCLFGFTCMCCSPFWHELRRSVFKHHDISRADFKVHLHIYVSLLFPGPSNYGSNSFRTSVYAHSEAVLFYFASSVFEPSSSPKSKMATRKLLVRRYIAAAEPPKLSQFWVLSCIHSDSLDAKTKWSIFNPVL